MAQVRVGFIGLGIMGRRMAGNMINDGRFDIIAAWDPSAESCQEAAGAFADFPLVESAEAVIEAEADLIYIASPPEYHRQYALAAAATGKAVYCEKPLTIDLDDGKALVEGLEASGVPNVINFIQSSAHMLELTLQRKDDGTLGDIVGGDIIVHFAKWPRDWQASADWLRFKDAGGYTREVLSHFVYVAMRIFGDVKLVTAHPRYPADPALCETHITALLDCAGVPVQIAGSSGGVGPDRVEFTLWGTKQSVKLHDWFWMQSSDGGEWTKELADIDDLRMAMYPRLMDNVIKAVKGEPTALPSARDAYRVQEIVEAMLRS